MMRMQYDHFGAFAHFLDTGIQFEWCSSHHHLLNFLRQHLPEGCDVGIGASQDQLPPVIMTKVLLSEFRYRPQVTHSGFIFMALVRGLLHLDLVRTNMHKVFVIGMYMVPSLLVFAATGQVRWLAGAVLAVGNSLGGWIGTRFQIARGEGVVRLVFSVAVVAMAIKLVIG